MRDIKFRVWIKHLKKMSNLIELYCDGGALAGDHEYPLDKNDIEVMQFSGLKDKEGVEIYEGDIIKSFHFTDHDDVMHFLEFKIKWSEKFGGWVVVRGDGSEMQLWVYSKSLDGYFYVIGNIYENPELLNGED